jgi:hypothetical protein
MMGRTRGIHSTWSLPPNLRSEEKAKTLQCPDAQEQNQQGEGSSCVEHYLSSLWLRNPPCTDRTS